MPHVTLLYPFAERPDFTGVAPLLAKAARQITPFSIELARFDAFKHRKSCTMFLVPEPENEIAQLHSALIQHLPNYDDTARFAGGFHPHLSIGQFQHRSLQSEQRRLQTEWQPIHCEIANLSLIYRSPETDDRFVVAEQFPSKQGVNSEYKILLNANRNFTYIIFWMRTSKTRHYTRHSLRRRYLHH